MAHTFLVQAGRWHLAGVWLERQKPPIAVAGKTIVRWAKDNWFTIDTNLTFGDRPEIITAAKGRLDYDEQRFSFVLQHSQMQKVEGEGWVGESAIVQRWWAMNDKQIRTGFETLYQKDDDCYYLSHSIVSGSFLVSTLEATLTKVV
jgi:hypothetical protein